MTKHRTTTIKPTREDFLTILQRHSITATATPEDRGLTIRGADAATLLQLAELARDHGLQMHNLEDPRLTATIFGFARSARRQPDAPLSESDKRAAEASQGLVSTSIRIEGAGRSHQSLEYWEHLTLAAGPSTVHKLRVHIRTDSYSSQAYGRIERWNGSEWKELAEIGGRSLAVDIRIGYSALSEAAIAEALGPDRARLITLALEIL